jgi:hypothetical protein
VIRLGIDVVTNSGLVAVSTMICTGPMDRRTRALEIELIIHCAENARQLSIRRNGSTPACTKSGHLHVDELHSIDFTEDKGAAILLTLKIEGV